MPVWSMQMHSKLASHVLLRKDYALSRANLLIAALCVASKAQVPKRIFV